MKRYLLINKMANAIGSEISKAIGMFLNSHKFDFFIKNIHNVFLLPRVIETIIKNSWASQRFDFKFANKTLVLLAILSISSVYSATISSTATGGNWNATTTWAGGVVPTSSDDVVIVSGSTITVDGDRYAKTLDIYGTLTFTTNNTSVILPANGTVHIVSPGSVVNSGSCTNNREIKIGTTQYAACTGGGSSVQNFTELNAAGGNCPSSAGTLSGNQYICNYGTKTTTFSSTVSGGTWSSSNTSIATVNASTGLITSDWNNYGAVTITYTVGGSGGCTQYTATRTVYVANKEAQSLGFISYNGTPYSNTPSPALNLCKGTTSLTFSIAGIPEVSGYVWVVPSSWTANVAADGLSATVTFPSNASSANIEVYASNGCNAKGVSSYIWLTLNNSSSTAPTITAQPATTGQTVCLNGTASAISVSASGSSSYTYQWYSNTTSSNSGGTLLSGATSSTYTPLTTSAGTKYYYCVVGGSCTPTVTSAVSGAIITNAASVGGTIAGSTAVCTGTNSTALTLSGHTGVVTKWQSSTSSTFASSVVDIANTTTSLTATNLTATTYYRAVITSGSCTATNSATGTITVNALSTIALTSGTQSPTVCSGSAITNTVYTFGGSATGATVGGLPSGLSSSVNGSTITISGTPTASGTYTITTTGHSSPCTAATISGTVTVSPITTANAGPDQVGASTSFVLAASGAGVWSIVSGPSTLLSQFSSTTNPTATFSPAVAGSYELQWTVSNSCGSFSDQVVVANCVSNLISNGDFTNTSSGNDKALNWTKASTFGNYVETYPETTYFSTGNTGSFTAELDRDASLRQVVSVIPGVSYTVSFRYGRRPGGSTPTTVAVNIKVTGGSSDILSPTLTTTSTTPQIGTFTFTPTASSIGIEFYNSLHGGSTLGTIIDDIVLVPSSQVAAYATTSPKGVFNTLTSCAGTAVQLGVDNVPSTGVTYSWTGSTGAVFSPSANSSNPTVTFTGSGIKQVTVTVTTSIGCSGSPSTTYVNVKESPTITTAATPAVVTAVCQSSSSQTTTMAYTATTGTPTSYSIAWTGISNQNSTAFAFASGGGSVTGITVPAGTAAGTYLGIMTITNDNSCTVTKNITLTVNPLPNNTGTSGFTGGSFCTGSQATVSFDALDAVGSPPYTLSYTNGSTTFSQTISTNSPTVFNVGATTSTTYTLISITDSKGCVNTNPDNKTANVTFRVNPTATISGTTAVCVGATNPSITFTNPQTAGITITYNVNGGANQTIAVPASSTNTVSVATATAGSFVYALSSVVYSTSPSCTQTISGSATVTVNAIPTAPAISSFSNINCTSATGSISLSGLPSSGTLSQTGTVANSYTISGTTMTVSNLAQGSYSFTVTNNGCTSASVSQAISNDSSTTWNGTSWSNSVPTATKAAVVNGPLTVSSNLAACSLTVTSGIVTVNSGITLTITNAVSVSGSGQLIFENNSSLIQTTNVANTGNITYKRVSSLMKNFDFTYWSSPVTGQTALALSPNTLADKYFRFSGSANDWVFDNGTMAAGAGYIIRVPKPGTWPNGEVVTDPYAQPVSFIGVPNNGNYSFAIGQDQYNLIGNPYPSAIDADSFITANSAVIYGALYFWTHNTAIAQSGSQYVYSSNDYATYNITGGAATSGGAIPTGKIAAGQSFFVGNSAAGSFVFNNSMRVAGNNSQFFKFSNTSKTNTIERNRLWLNLTNEGGAFKQLLVGYITGATNNWDDLYDGASFDGNDYVDFYSVNKTDNLTIQGRALPFDTTDFVPLGYRSTVAGLFEIAIDKTDGVLSNQEILLEDKKTGVTHNLSKAKYTFTAIKGVENDRFVLKYGKTQLSIDKTEIVDQKVIVYQKNKIITIESAVMPIESIAVYDLLGRKIYSQDQVNSNKFIIDKLNSSEQLLIIKTTLEDKTVTTEKVAF